VVLDRLKRGLVPDRSVVAEFVD